MVFMKEYSYWKAIIFKVMKASHEIGEDIEWTIQSKRRMRNKSIFIADEYWKQAPKWATK